MPYAYRKNRDVTKRLDDVEIQPQKAESDTMINNSVKPTVIGTRSGYVIRFTCPDCNKENTIVFNMPKAFYKESRDGTCSKCRKRFTVLTPGHN